ncbi:hypothetical protein [Methanosarcina mazei]|uniref:hypothetical protein n=1 Tax=Methanosarcina mazei TaxID=2209 RepID=UPI003C7776B8
MKIELINPAPKLLNKFGQYSPPYGLAYIGTLLMERGIEVKIIGNYSGSLLKATIFPLFEEKLDIN